MGLEYQNEEAGSPASLEQLTMPGFDSGWQREWLGMPEFVQDDLTPIRSLTVHFETQADMDQFRDLIGQTITPNTKSLWYPEAEITRYLDKRYSYPGSEPYACDLPQFPLYIVSKGRADSRLTNRALAAMGVPHFIVVESPEVDTYRRHVEGAEVLELDPSYKRDYETCDDLGDMKSKGPGAARNFAWDHALSKGFKWHWVMDDNINGFFRLNFNLKTPCVTGAIFRAMEDFVLRYSNVGMAGPNYFMFASRKSRMPAFVLNTRIYSCNLIRNDVPFRWRGRYNEDTDISLRMLKAGVATVQFNAFLQRKTPTQALRGGNSADFYDKEGTLPKSLMIEDLHPDIAKVVFRFGRWHHYVDFSPFSGIALKPVDRNERRGDANNYGMTLEKQVNGSWSRIDRPEPEKKKHYTDSPRRK